MQRRALHKGHSPNGDPLDPDEAGFACAVVCGSCGHLQWPDHRDSPHRRDALATTSDLPRCSHCNDQAWIDLAPESTAFELRKSEKATLRMLLGHRALVGVSVFLGAWLGIWMGALFFEIWPLLGIPVGVLAGTAGALGTYWLEKKAIGPLPTLPSRWAMALPPADMETQELRGIPRPRGDLLTSPITGQPCLGYELGIRDDPDPTGKLPTWTLLEQRVIDFELDGHTFEGAETHLDLARQYLGSDESLELQDPARLYLRQRGFGRTTPAPHIYETIVPPATEVVLLHSKERAILRLAPKGLPEARPED
jgi:hypothetical protein